VDVSYVAHPSFVEADELAAIKGPLSISAAGKFHLVRVELENETVRRTFLANVYCRNGCYLPYV